MLENILSKFVVEISFFFLVSLELLLNCHLLYLCFDTV